MLKTKYGVYTIEIHRQPNGDAKVGAGLFGVIADEKILPLAQVQQLKTLLSLAPPKQLVAQFGDSTVTIVSLVDGSGTVKVQTGRMPAITKAVPKATVDEIKGLLAREWA